MLLAERLPMAASSDASPRQSFCEFTRYKPIRRRPAFYVTKADKCFVAEEQVQPRPGWFYGGCVTADIAGPFRVGLGRPGDRGLLVTVPYVP